MGFEFSPSQKRALEFKRKNLLISAGAGSGKTQVLSQKVHDIIKGVGEGATPVSPDQLLVITFTVKAAFEMKERIKKNLKKNGMDQSIIDKIDSAHIQTFDSFFNFLVKKYAGHLGISSNINIIDENINTIKLHQFSNEIIEELYSSKSLQFLNILKNTTIKSDDEFKDLLVSTYQSMSRFADVEYKLENYENLYLNEDVIKKDFDDFISLSKTFLKNIDDIYYEYNDFIYYDSAEIIHNFYNKLVQLSNEEFYSKLTERLSYPEFPKREEKNEVADKQIKKYKEKVLDPIRKDLKKYGSLSDNLNRILGSKDDILFLISLIQKLDAKLNAYKKLTNSYTFNDLSKMALKLFNDEKIKDEIRNSFKFILVDEYQDTSDIQETFIKHMDNDNLYMVGDVKQSIYRFRFANCDIFRDKYNLYKNDTTKGEKVDLVDNFRSRKEILNDVNEVFKNVMSDKMGGADYREDHIIKYGLKEYENNVSNTEFYGTKILNYNSKEHSPESEAKIIANKILDIINSDTKVYDKDIEGENKLRPIKFSDFAILIRRKKHFNLFKQIFNDFNIPLSCDTKNSYFEYESLLLIESILTGINYFRCNLDDELVKKYIYTSITRSYIYSYADDKILEDLRSKEYNNHEIFEKCSRIAEISKENTIETVFNVITKEFEIIKNLFRLSDPEANLDKIEYLHGIARTFDGSNLSLEDFANFFQQLKEFNLDFEIENLDTTKNAVQLMTDHKSKGLEWPFVFLSDISDRPRNVPDIGKGKFNNFGGILYSCYNGQLLKPFYYKYNSMLDEYEEGSEAIRLFYVAMTRAREGLFFVINETADENEIVPIFKNRAFYNILRNSKVKLPVMKCSEKDNILNKDSSVISFGSKVESFNELKHKFEIKVKKTASHAVEEDELTEKVQQMLDLGNELHGYMQCIDFKNIDDISFIKNESKRNKIKKVLSLDIFKECKNSSFIDAYKEYEFIDDNIHGFVDLFLLFEDKIEIIDYKLKNINKPEYVEQLKTYKDYLEKVFKKPCKTRLISLVEGIDKEIEHEA